MTRKKHGTQGIILGFLTLVNSSPPGQARPAFLLPYLPEKTCEPPLVPEMHWHGCHEKEEAEETQETEEDQKEEKPIKIKMNEQEHPDLFDTFLALLSVFLVSLFISMDIKKNEKKQRKPDFRLRAKHKNGEKFS